MGTEANIVEGIVRYVRKELTEQINAEAEKIVAKVIADVAQRLEVISYTEFDTLTTKVVFRFEKAKE